MSTSGFLEIDAASLTFEGRSALRGMSLTLAPREILGIAGPSGSGKTTLLRVVLGLVAPSEGTVRLDGRLASEPGRILIPPHQRGLSVVFQDLALWPHLSVARHLEFVLELAGPSRADRERKIRDMLARLGLSSLAERLPTTLSGGEQQRVALARALVVEPKLVLFDEPLASLDVALKSDLRSLIAELLTERGTAALYVAHDPTEIASFVSRVVVMEAGSLVQSGSIEELRRSPASDFVRAFTRH